MFVGTVAEWEEWTGLAFPESGEYVIRGALNPVVVDRDRDEGILTEPNAWMIHKVEDEAGLPLWRDVKDTPG